MVKYADPINTKPNAAKTPETEKIVRIIADTPGARTKENSLQVENTVVISVLIFGVTIRIKGIFPIISSISIPIVAKAKRSIPKKIFGLNEPTRKKQIPDKIKL